MTAALDLEFADLADDLLQNEFGSQVTVHRQGTPTDPVTGAAGTADSTYTTYAAVVEYTDEQIDGDRIQQGDVMLIIDNSTAPLSNDKPEIDGNKYAIKHITPFRSKASSGATIAAYGLQCRK